MDILVSIHDWVRWLVLLGALGAIGTAAAVWFGNVEWRLADRAGLIYTILVDVEVLIGIIVWISAVVSSKSVPNLLIVLHPILMLVALGVAHMTRARADKTESPQGRAPLATVGYLASLVIILLAIPGGLLVPPAP